MLYSISSEKWYLNQMLTVSGYDTLSHKLYYSVANSGSVSMEPNQRAGLCLSSLKEAIAVCSEKNFPHLVFGKRGDFAWSSYITPHFPTSPREAP